MKNNQTTALLALALVGDGDEVAAIEAVEQSFGIRFDTTDASNWVVVGDVYDALKAALPLGVRDAPEIWARFAQAICQESGDDPLRLTPETRLLETGRWSSGGRFVIQGMMIIGALILLVLSANSVT